MTASDVTAADVPGSDATGTGAPSGAGIAGADISSELRWTAGGGLTTGARPGPLPTSVDATDPAEWANVGWTSAPSSGESSVTRCTAAAVLCGAAEASCWVCPGGGGKVT